MFMSNISSWCRLRDFLEFDESFAMIVTGGCSFQTMDVSGANDVRVEALALPCSYHYILGPAVSCQGF